ncbi:MAG TPA: response regulator, partial [Bryobacteraceae bacterium]|nr:response regulator [Bryobacteraceae bacterium]
MRQSAEILLVEDSPADAELTSIAVRQSPLNSNLTVVRYGSDAIHYLKREGKFATAPRPDLIFLDWNLPDLDGADVLAFLKSGDLKVIPVIILTSSRLAEDVSKAYEMRANCFI